MPENKLLPYGRQSIAEEDIQAVIEVLRSDWLTTGPKIAEFEQAIAEYVGCQYAVAVSSGTAALHAALFAIGIQSGDEVILPAITFVATANAVIYMGGTPVFADVDPATLLIDSSHVASLINEKTKAIVAVDYAGQPCDYDFLSALARNNGLFIVSDASHSLGASCRGRKCGSLADLTTFSFHPVKPLTTAEGGMVCTDSHEYAGMIRTFRNHGISQDHHLRREQAHWHYDVVGPGYNYRLSDLHCALGLSQLKKIDEKIAQRRVIATAYLAAFAENKQIRPLHLAANVEHGYHLFVVKVPADKRKEIFRNLRKQGIGVNVHYLPLYLHPYYRELFNTEPGLCPMAEQAYEQILSLPIFPGMTMADVDRVIRCLFGLLGNG